MCVCAEWPHIAAYARLLPPLLREAQLYVPLVVDQQTQQFLSSASSAVVVPVISTPGEALKNLLLQHRRVAASQCAAFFGAHRRVEVWRLGDVLPFRLRDLAGDALALPIDSDHMVAHAYYDTDRHVTDTLVAATPLWWKALCLCSVLHCVVADAPRAPQRLHWGWVGRSVLVGLWAVDWPPSLAHALRLQLVRLLTHITPRSAAVPPQLASEVPATLPVLGVAAQLLARQRLDHVVTVAQLHTLAYWVRVALGGPLRLWVNTRHALAIVRCMEEWLRGNSTSSGARAMLERVRDAAVAVCKRGRPAPVCAADGAALAWLCFRRHGLSLDHFMGVAALFEEEPTRVLQQRLPLQAHRRLNAMLRLRSPQLPTPSEADARAVDDAANLARFLQMPPLPPPQQMPPQRFLAAVDVLVSTLEADARGAHIAMPPSEHIREAQTAVNHGAWYPFAVLDGPAHAPHAHECWPDHELVLPLSNRDSVVGSDALSAVLHDCPGPPSFHEPLEGQLPALVPAWTEAAAGAPGHALPQAPQALMMSPPRSRLTLGSTVTAGGGEEGDDGGYNPDNPALESYRRDMQRTLDFFDAPQSPEGVDAANEAAVRASIARLAAPEGTTHDPERQVAVDVQKSIDELWRVSPGDATALAAQLAGIMPYLP